MKLRSCTPPTPIVALLVLVVAQLACGGQSSGERLVLYPSPTSDATQTPVVVTVVNTKVVQITSTPVPSVTSTPVRQLCVSAVEAVHLRPSPSTENNITELVDGTRVTDLGGEQDGWRYVEVDGKRGWINGKYLENC